MRKRMLAVAFGPPTMAAACAGLQRIRAVADCVELRLDLFEEPFDLPTLLQERGDLPVVATLRPPSEGGRSTLGSLERMKVLVKAAELGAEYVDLEWDAASPEALGALRAAGAQVIVSRHDFQSMPDLAGDWWPRLAELGADVVKVVGACGEVRDGRMVLRTFERASQPTIAIGMGEPGLPTRVLALRSDRCVLTYASLDAGLGTAPGQISVTDMREVYRASKIGSETRAFGLLGPHVEGDRLREYNAWFDTDTLDAVAVPFVADSDAAGIVEAFRDLPVSGWHIHAGDLQRDVVRVLDSMDATAARQAKVNAVVRRDDGALIGHWVESPREQYELWRSASG
jgi:3-dehydroquinate dehydratase / shikimate dehydrogenase